MEICAATDLKYKESVAEILKIFDQKNTQERSFNLKLEKTTAKCIIDLTSFWKNFFAANTKVNQN